MLAAGLVRSMQEIIFLNIGESLVWLAFGLSLHGVFLPWRRLIGPAIALGVAIGVYRAWFPLLVHLVLLIASLVLLFRFVGGLRWSRSVLSALSVVIASIVGEALIATPVFQGVFQVAPAQLIASPTLFVLSGWLALTPSAVILIALYFRRQRKQPSGRMAA